LKCMVQQRRARAKKLEGEKPALKDRWGGGIFAARRENSWRIFLLIFLHFPSLDFTPLLCLSFSILSFSFSKFRPHRHLLENTNPNFVFPVYLLFNN
jgi:hypothetical protein